jgi:hypothetical protein
MIDLPDLGGSRRPGEEDLELYTVCSFTDD